METLTDQTVVWTQRGQVVSILDLMAESEREARARLAQLRKAHDLSQEALASAAKVSAQTLSRWERGKTQPHRKTVEAVARVLDVEPEELRANLDEVVSISDRLERIERVQEALLNAVRSIAPSRAGLSDKPPEESTPEAH